MNFPVIEQAHILVVEDESGIRASLALVLEMEGYIVSTASDGEQALARIQDAPPDLIVTDFVMPRMNGGELIRRIRDSEQMNLPIILMSAALPPRDNVRELCDAFIDKPFSVDHLLGLIEDALGATRQR